MILDRTIKELERAFDFLNDNLFDSELEKPIITIQTSGKSKSLAWCTTKPIWENEDKELKYEINIGAETLDRGAMEVCHSLLHEMCHLYDYLNGIRDCNGKIHNKKYKDTAEAHGLWVDRDKSYGWGITGLQPETKNLINKIVFDESALAWKRIPEEHKDKEQKTTYKYTCPECGTKFTIKYEIEAKCKECGVNFNMEVKNPTIKEEGE